VARQYCGQLGKQDNCQVAVSLSVANDMASLPIAFRLYLPEDWAADRERRQKAGVPEAIVFRIKPAIALEQIEAALQAGITRGVVLADAGYGNDTSFREQLTTWDLAYVVGVQSSSTVWPPDTAPLPPKPYRGTGRPPKLVRRDAEHQPVTVKGLAMSLPRSRYRSVAWREGSAGTLRSRLPACGSAHRDYWRATPWPEEWLLIEWPDRRARADQLLPPHAPCRHAAQGTGRPRQAALAHRARLSGPEAGARARPLRGARLARLPPPRGAHHRRLRIPGLRAESDSPLSARMAPEAAAPTQRFPPARLASRGRNGTPRTPLRPAAGRSP
jgi:hypothetical protein